MVSANDKGKDSVKDDLQDSETKEEIESEVEEEAKEDQHPHTSTTIASIGVVANPAKFKRTARMSNGEKVPRHCLASWSPPPRTKNPFHTLIHEQQF